MSRKNPDAAERVRPDELLAGLAVIILVILLTLVAAWRSGAFERLTRARKPAVTWFRSIGTLKTKEPVLFRGYPIGEVLDIEYDNVRRMARISMEIDADFRLPPIGTANITTPSLAALSSYIEILPREDILFDTSRLVLADPRPEATWGRIREESGMIIIDGADPVSMGNFLTQGSGYLARADAQVAGLLESANAYLSKWEQTVKDPMVRAQIHGGAAEARAMTTRAAEGVRDGAERVETIRVAAEEADRWVADHEDTIAATLVRADEGASGAAVWTREFMRAPALMKDR